MTEREASEDLHNPFAAPERDNTALDARKQQRRPVWLIVFLACQLLCYSVFVIFSATAAIAILEGIPLMIYEVALQLSILCYVT